VSGELERITRVAFVGFGEAGGILGAALAAKGVQVSMYDVRIGALREKAARSGVQAADTLAQAIVGAQLIVSARMKPRARSVWIFSAASSAEPPMRRIHVRTSFSPAVK